MRHYHHGTDQPPPQSVRRDPLDHTSIHKDFDYEVDSSWMNKTLINTDAGLAGLLVCRVGVRRHRGVGGVLPTDDTLSIIPPEASGVGGTEESTHTPTHIHCSCSYVLIVRDIHCARGKASEPTDRPPS